MNIFIEIPTWLGDAIMSAPAVENLTKKYPKAKITFFGSYVSTELFKAHPNCKETIIDDSKKRGIRALNIYNIAIKAGYFDMAFSFRSSFFSKLLLLFLKAKEKFQYDKKEFKGHQVEKYNSFANKALKSNYGSDKLKLYFDPVKFKKPTLGINPGATYGSAKRWYPEYFAKVATYFSKEYDIIIFGGPNEKEVADDIAKILKKEGVENYTNLAGKTTIEELVKNIAGLSFFVTNDSGPMHIAAAFEVPTVAIFGPTKHKETCQWQNKNGVIVRHEIECAPCMKRVCPLEHHKCMKNIKPEEVIGEIVKKLL